VAESEGGGEALLRRGLPGEYGGGAMGTLPALRGVEQDELLDEDLFGGPVEAVGDEDGPAVAMR
jgi:hypothetical protein